MWTRGVIAITVAVTAIVLGYAWWLWVAYAWWVAGLFLIEALLIAAGSWYLQGRMTRGRE